jgi:hypothetical protein
MNLKDPHSITLEPDCPSPQTFHYDIVSGERRKKTLINHIGNKYGDILNYPNDEEKIWTRNSGQI